jgi:ClpP class serine protease
MANPLEIVTRLFRRNSVSAIVAEIYGKAINQPLFIHPALGEMIVQGYLHSDIAQLQGDAGRRGQNQAEATVGILDISGALVARETPGVCGSGPLSYEEIRNSFDTMLADSNIKTIIGRFDTPGGMAAQNMDLADHIYASRGQGKRLIAMVDDMAYSAGYALASSFDEIWITRTGGVGSVGVVSYHVDQSGFNDKLGVKIEYIYAGARKIDGNPHAELTDEARTRFQGEVTRLYNLFSATVARNLGLSVDAVKKTEAGTFHGEEAVNAGFAHKVGTFSELLQSLIPVGQDHIVTVTMEDQSLEAEQSEKTDIASNTGESESESEEKNDNPDSNKNLQSSAENKSYGEKLKDLKQRRDPDGIEDKKSESPLSDSAQLEQQAAEIRSVCTAAKRQEAAEHYITAGMTVQQVREDLMKLLAAGQIDINGASPVTLVTSPQAQAQEGWAKAFQKAKY